MRKEIIVIIFFSAVAMIINLLDMTQGEINSFIESTAGVSIFYVVIRLIYKNYIKNKSYLKSEKAQAGMNAKFLANYDYKKLGFEILDGIYFGLIVALIQINAQQKFIMDNFMYSLIFGVILTITLILIKKNNFKKYGKFKSNSITRGKQSG